MSSIWILGGGAIGTAVAEQKCQSGSQVTLITRHTKKLSSSVNQLELASWDWEDVVTTLQGLTLPDQVLVTNGMLWSQTIQPEKRTESLTKEGLQEAFNANVLVSAACLQHLSGRLKRDSSLTFMAVSAKVGSISDNRLGGWHAYRSSKAALNMLVKTTAIEWQRRFPNTALATYHPGTTDSGLSEPFQQRVSDGQLKSPAQAARCLIQVLDEHISPVQSGQLWNWDGSVLPF